MNLIFNDLLSERESELVKGRSYEMSVSKLYTTKKEGLHKRQYISVFYRLPRSFIVSFSSWYS